MIETLVVIECSSGQSLRNVTAFNSPFGAISSEVVTFRQGCSWREQLKRKLKESKARHHPEDLAKQIADEIFPPVACPQMSMCLCVGILAGSWERFTPERSSSCDRREARHMASVQLAEN
jgi:hypothetical protein